ncbi:hypothetical protein JM946_12165 [Steroidobacter sp. S1-65]|uniref:Uncharacterized protein n=1 Tax=Steroidobacter gossypii TaxID=2805490 RepID=A0ABS1WX03_9GAMM|nr:hypothetical protein [Steroidobacter gossypii]MBM0105511.1 hypothetical protein [Steroidobacter gossypii]
MTQLRHDAAYIRTESRGGRSMSLTSFDEQVYETLSSAHTVTSAAKALAGRSSDNVNSAEDLEARVADSMLRLLEAERIELSPDS